MIHDRPALTVTALAASREPVDLHLQNVGGTDTVLKGVVVTHVTKTWLGIAYRRRGVLHELCLPHAAIKFLDRRSRSRPRL